VICPVLEPLEKGAGDGPGGGARRLALCPAARLPAAVGQYHLMVTLDDATSAIYSAFPVAAAGTLSSFRGIAEVIDQHGLFCELYTDRGSHYFDTPTPARRSRRRCALRWQCL